MKIKRKFWNDPRIVDKTPVVTVLFMETASIGQIVEMVRTRSADGQSLFSWSMIIMALALWYNFYRVCTPEQKWARRTTMLGIVMNIFVLMTAIYFKTLG